MKWSYETRKEMIDTLTSQKLDLLIIGGGITGAGLALQAGAQDLKAGLIEMQDFAAGTSGRSTKLVHGGLRYLKQFEVELVADILKEREVIYQNAPHIVQPEKMLLPVYEEEGASFTDFSSEVALDLYDRLAGVEGKWAHTMISKEEVLDDIPALKEEDLIKGGFYLDYVNDDARLTLEILKKGLELGTSLVNYVKATGFLYDDNEQIIGVEAEDTLTGEKYEIEASVVVNATGPWSDKIRNKQKDEDADRMYPTKGVHFVVDSSRLPVKHTVYTDTGLEDERMIFIIPRGGKTYFGTTDTPYEGDLAEPGITRDDVDYLLKAVNYRFPEAELTLEDVESGWSGLRPLILEEDAADASSISRTHDIFVSDAGLVTIAGGKLTDYRLMAQDTFEYINAELEEKTGKSYTNVETKHIPLSGGDVPDEVSFDDYIAQNVKDGLAVGLPEEQAASLIDWYGTNAETVFSLEAEAKQIDLPLNLALALVYAVKYEGVLTPVDFFSRRTGILPFSANKVDEWKPPVVDYMQEIFEWNDEERTQWMDALNDTISKVQLNKLRD